MKNSAKKTIIAIKNIAGKGKTSSCRAFADYLLSQRPIHRIIIDNNYSVGTSDFRLVVEIDGIIIAIESQGDPGTNLDVRLAEVINRYSPHILITTCRTSGVTYNAINAYQTVYEIIWTSTYESPQGTHGAVNVIKGIHIFDLLQRMEKL